VQKPKIRELPLPLNGSQKANLETGSIVNNEAAGIMNRLNTGGLNIERIFEKVYTGTSSYLAGTA
jgi:hypothetical protein